MAAKIRKQLYIEPAQEAELKRLAKVTGQTEAAVVRSALDRYLTGIPSPVPDESAWQAILSFLETRSALALVESKKTWTREEVHRRSETL